MKPRHRILMAIAAVAAAGCAGVHRHVPIDPKWIEAASEERSPPVDLPEPGKAVRPLRVAVYGDTRGGRETHRAVIAAIRSQRPDLVVFTGDALECRPVGNLPDFGAWTYLVPFWPQHLRGRWIYSLTSIVPFPALIHEVFVVSFLTTRDPDGLNGFLQDTEPLRVDDRVPLLFVAGNHDLYHRRDREDLARLFGAPWGNGGKDPEALWFAVDAGGVRWIVLDTGTGLLGDGSPIRPGGLQLSWLEGVLKDAHERGLRPIVACHLPPFASAREEGSVDAVRRHVVEGVLDRHRVDLVLSGHAHAYERIIGPGGDGRRRTYIVTGGGGAPYHHGPGPGARVEGSQAFVEGSAHFVLLEIDGAGIRGRRIAADGGWSTSTGAFAAGEDRFEIRP